MAKKIIPVKHGIFTYVACSVILVVLIAVGLVFCEPFFRDYPPQKVDFQGYSPTILPAGARITDQELTRTIYRDQNYSHFMYRLLVRGQELQIYESKKDEYSADPLTCYSFGDPCQELVTQAGQHYIITHGEYQDKPFDLQVSWVKGDTELVLSVDDSVLPLPILTTTGGL